MLALSTSWNASRYSRAKDIIEEIAALGFKQVELNFNLTSQIVEGMLKLADQGRMQVVSVHNFCPIPEGVPRTAASPDMFSLAALDEQERQKAIEYTQRTIDTAARLQAEAVVLHLGRVQTEEKIRQLAQAAEDKDKKKYQQLKTQMVKSRRQKAKQYFHQALESLKQLSDYAHKLNLKLGIENRYYFNEIPSVPEMETILKRFPGPPIYYWHDSGHAQVYENLGLFKHQVMLEKFKQRMVGIHLHDIEGIDDHRAPLQGKFDFGLLKSYLHPATLKVLEPHQPASPEEIIRGKNYLEQLFEEKTN